MARMARGGVRRGAESDYAGRLAKTTPRSSQQVIQSQLRAPEGQFSARGGAFGRGQGFVREAWVGSQNTFHTASMRAMVCSAAGGAGATRTAGLSSSPEPSQ